MKNKHAQQLGKLGGQVKSKIKTEAVRKNGKKGGRPKITFSKMSYQNQIKVLEGKLPFPKCEIKNCNNIGNILHSDCTWCEKHA